MQNDDDQQNASGLASIPAWQWWLLIGICVVGYVLASAPPGYRLTDISTSGDDLPAVAAERRYEIVAAGSGSWRERCAAATAVKQAWLQEENADKYEHWSIVADGQCIPLIGS